jgi:hypothetical protein
MKITEILGSSDSLNALESAICALPGGREAVEAAIAAALAQHQE